MKLVPQLPLHLAHVGPGVHFICFDVLNFFLCLTLLSLAAFEVFDQISILRIFNYHLCHFLRSFDLVYLHLVLESLLNDFSYGQVVNFLLRVQLSLADGLKAARRVSL
jgi:hypothetical protein